MLQRIVQPEVVTGLMKCVAHALQENLTNHCNCDKHYHTERHKFGRNLPSQLSSVDKPQLLSFSFMRRKPRGVHCTFGFDNLSTALGSAIHLYSYKQELGNDAAA